jgi:hypothetical protein
MKRFILGILVIAGVAGCARQPYYRVSGKVVDYKTGKGIPGMYVAFQGFYIAAFFGGPEYFDDLALDSTDRNGNFSIKVSAAIADSFAKEHGGILGSYCFALDARSTKRGEMPDLYRFLHIPCITIYDNSIEDRVYINQRTKFLTPDNKHFRKDITGLVVPFYKGSFLQFQLPKGDTTFFNNSYLYVDVREVTDKDSLIWKGHTSYDKAHLHEYTLVRPYIPFNITLAKAMISERRLDTFAILKNVSLQPGEIKKIILAPPNLQ